LRHAFQQLSMRANVPLPKWHLSKTSIEPAKFKLARSVGAKIPDSRGSAHVAVIDSIGRQHSLWGLWKGR
jgi:hypothetical protein